MDLTALNDQFAIPGILRIAEHDGLPYADITAPGARASVYLHGAHLTNWQPAGHEPVLFMSMRSDYAAGKPLRGGVPICFPWFGPRQGGLPGPSHGFARISDWNLAFAAQAGDDVHLTFTLAPNELSRSLGFDDFHLAFQLTLGRTLTMQFTVANDASTPLVFEDALHTYFAVADATRATVSGLEGTAFIDKIDGMQRKPGLSVPLSFTQSTDRVFPGTSSDCVLADPVGGRRIRIHKHNSNTTVVWNPWSDGAAKIADMEPQGWTGMVCVETANTGDDAITLAPGQAHTTTAIITVEKTAA